MSNVAEKPGCASFWISAFAFIACFLIFAVIIRVAKFPTSADVTRTPGNLTAEERLEKNILTPEERRVRLDELRASEQAAARSYQWVDQSAGVARLPVERAIELTVRDLRQQQKPQSPR